MPIEPSYKISFKHNSFLWLPFKTSSTTVSWILGHFDFCNYTYDSVNEKYVEMYPSMFHLGHDMYLPPTHEQMNFICTMRNPYDIILSYFKMWCRQKNIQPKKNDFKENLESFIFKNHLISDLSKISQERKPNFILRTENLLEDLLKIPFIKDSKLNQCGILEEMTQKKLNVSFPVDVDELLDQDDKTKIYEMFKFHFDFFGYSR